MKKLMIIFFSLLIGFCSLLSAQDFVLQRSVINGGGNAINNTSYTLKNSIGQPTIGKITNLSYNLYTGFWHPLYQEPVPPGWTQKEDVPQADDIKTGKFVKDGGAIVGIGTDVYVLPGNKSFRFYKYGEAGWDTTLATMPFGLKYKPGTALDSTKPNNKKVGKGAALCYDGASKIYAVKGNGTFEFWAYDLTSDAGWTAKAFVPTVKGLKGGTSIAYLDGYVYLLAGGQKLENDFFFKYEIAADTWHKLTNPVAGTKKWKIGSAITAFNGKIYAMKAGEKPNYFCAYDTTTPAGWITPAETLTTFDNVWTGSAWKSKKIYVKDGGALVAADDAMYAIKGGGSFNFFKYTSSTGWVQLQSDTIPRIGAAPKKSVPKAGAALTAGPGRVWLMKGNNTQEFWVYGISAKGGVARVNSNVISSTMTENIATAFDLTVNVTPNPIIRNARINYSLPVTARATLKLYNASGRLVETLLDNTMSAGNYTLNFNAAKLAKGVYFLKYEVNNSKSEVKLIVQ